MEPGQIDRNIAGLCANKIMAKYQRAVCILTKTEITEEINKNENGVPFDPPYIKKYNIYQGSARGCDRTGITEFKDICSQTGVCEYTIGHQGAFGLGILEDNVQEFIEKTNLALKDTTDEAIYYVDYIYDGVNVNPEHILDIASFQDLWGKDIDEPLVAVEGLKVTPDMITVYDILSPLCEVLKERITYLLTATEPPADVKAQLDTLIYASSRIEMDDLYKLRHLVQKKYGIYYIEAADQNRDGLVNVNVIEKLKVKPASDVFLTIRLKQICKEKKFNYEFPEDISPNGDGGFGGNPYDSPGGNPYSAGHSSFRYRSCQSRQTVCTANPA